MTDILEIILGILMPTAMLMLLVGIIFIFKEMKELKNRIRKLEHD